MYDMALASGQRNSDIKSLENTIPSFLEAVFDNRFGRISDLMRASRFDRTVSRKRGQSGASCSVKFPQNTWLASYCLNAGPALQAREKLRAAAAGDAGPCIRPGPISASALDANRGRKVPLNVL